MPRSVHTAIYGQSAGLQTDKVHLRIASPVRCLALEAWESAACTTRNMSFGAISCWNRIAVEEARAHPELELWPAETLHVGRAPGCTLESL